MIQKLLTQGFLWEEKVNDFLLENIDKLVKKEEKVYFKSWGRASQI